MHDFLGSKMGPFHKSKKKHNKILFDSNTSSFITTFFELQFDTPTWIIPSFRTTQAGGCIQSFKSDLLFLRNYLVPGT